MNANVAETDGHSRLSLSDLLRTQSSSLNSGSSKHRNTFHKFPMFILPLQKALMPQVVKVPIIRTLMSAVW